MANHVKNKCKLYHSFDIITIKAYPGHIVPADSSSLLSGFYTTTQKRQTLATGASFLQQGHGDGDSGDSTAGDTASTSSDGLAAGRVSAAGGGDGGDAGASADRDAGAGDGDDGGRAASRGHNATTAGVQVGAGGQGVGRGRGRDARGLLAADGAGGLRLARGHDGSRGLSRGRGLRRSRRLGGSRGLRRSRGLDGSSRRLSSRGGRLSSGLGAGLDLAVANLRNGRTDVGGKGNSCGVTVSICVFASSECWSKLTGQSGSDGEELHDERYLYLKDKKTSVTGSR